LAASASPSARRTSAGAPFRYSWQPGSRAARDGQDAQRRVDGLNQIKTRVNQCAIEIEDQQAEAARIEVAEEMGS